MTLYKFTGKINHYDIVDRNTGEIVPMSTSDMITYENPNRPFVYIWYHGIEKKYYIGCHNGKQASYTHSSSKLERVDPLNVPPYMSRRIIKEFDNDSDAKAFERILIEKALRKNPNKYYNKCPKRLQT